ncbi:MAG: DNA cytosine methyltransferase [Planctomycetota bacterium]|jgi:site-specific DNA-cytosine methylase
MRLDAVRAIELFAGIGGMHAACPWLDVVAAVDINRDSQAVYTQNFTTPYVVRELQTIPFPWLESQRADLWWMSPPCTPFTRKGERRDLQDVRTRSLMHLVEAVRCIRPSIVVLENVVGFEASQAFATLSEAWQGAGYHVQLQILCPTQLGWPNRRPRVYVVASQSSVSVPSPAMGTFPLLKEMMQANAGGDAHRNLSIAPEISARYRLALDIVEADDPFAVAACFGSSYGRVVTKAGSYVKTDFGLRRFAPREVANILGFPSSFVLPDHFSARRLWQLLGNSLSLPAVAHLMQFTK